MVYKPGAIGENPAKCQSFKTLIETKKTCAFKMDSESWQSFRYALYKFFFFFFKLPNALQMSHSLCTLGAIPNALL